MDDQRDTELGRALAELETPAYDDAFWPGIWAQLIAESKQALGPDDGEHATADVKPRRRRRRWRVAFAGALVVLLALVGAAVTAVAVPGFAQSVPFLGRQIRELERENRQLKGDAQRVAAQQQTLLGKFAGAYQAAFEEQTPATALAESTGLWPVVHSYFTDLAQAQVVGTKGDNAASALDDVIALDSALRDRVHFLIAGLRARQAGLRQVPTAATTVIRAYSVDLDDAGRHATVVVWPGLTFLTWVAPRNGPQTANFSLPYHTLSLGKSDDGQWMIDDDVYADSQLTALLREGGAPAALVADVERQQAQLAQGTPAPEAAVATLRDTFDLINHGDYDAASRSFVGNQTDVAASLRKQAPSIDVRSIASARPIDPLPPDSVLLQVQAHVQFAGDPLAGFPTYWVMQKQSDGSWMVSETLSSP